MATARVDNVNMQLKFDGGVHEGKQKYITKAIPGVALDAGDDGIYTVAKKLESLQQKNMVAIKKIVISEISA